MSACGLTDNVWDRGGIVNERTSRPDESLDSQGAGFYLVLFITVSTPADPYPDLFERQTMKEAFVVFLGGGAGSVFRYWLSGGVYRLVGPAFPYGTLLVNVLGCFLIGFVMSIFEERYVVQPLLRTFLSIGILGGFTTFSTFSFETIALLREGSFLLGFVNILYSLCGCLCAAWAGAAIGKLL